MIRLIVSVGTSTVMNAFKLVSAERKYAKKMPRLSKIVSGFSKTRKSVENPLAYLENKLIALEDAGLRPDLDEVIDELVMLMMEGDPTAISAEFNTMLNMDIKIEPDTAKITFLATDTSTGKLCGGVLHQFMSTLRFDCVLEVIRDFSYETHEKFERGIMAYTNALITNIESARIQNEAVALIVTGGFKPQIVYSAIIAMLYEVPIIYYNELFLNAFFLPPLPLKLDRGFWNEFKEQLMWFEQPRTVEEIKKKMGAIPKQISFFVEKKEEQGTQISALGRILVQLFNSPSYSSYS